MGEDQSKIQPASRIQKWASRCNEASLRVCMKAVLYMENYNLFGHKTHCRERGHHEPSVCETGEVL